MVSKGENKFRFQAVEDPLSQKILIKVLSLNFTSNFKWILANEWSFIHPEFIKKPYDFLMIFVWVEVI